MIIYIKKSKDFTLAGKADAESWNLPLEAVSTESGSIVIAGENRDCVGDWLCILGKVVLITQAQPRDGKTTLATADPTKYFDRQLFFPAAPEPTYGAFIKATLEREYINCVDEGFRLPYMKVTATDTTTLSKPDLDETNLFRLTTVMASARRRGVVIDFSLGKTEKPGDTLLVNIYKGKGDTKKVFFNDGHAQLSTETYSPNGIAKITVMKEQKTESTDDQKVFELSDFYLSADGDVTSTPPANRAPGRWEYATCQDNDVPLRRASALFSDNLESHKIEFDADFRLNLYDNVILRLHGGVYSSQIVYVGTSSKDSRYHYKCGELAVTLTDKVKQADGSTKQTFIQVPTLKKSDLNEYAKTADLSAYAPSGFGLGDTSLPRIENVNDAVKNGWYHTINTDTNQPVAAGAWMRVDSATSDYLMQTWYHEYHGIAQRLKSGTWQPWEWVQPRMDEGVEYRTTERRNGRVVYTKLINCGAAANGKAVNSGANNIFRHSGSLGIGSESLPYQTRVGQTWWAESLVSSGATLYLYCSDNFVNGGYTWYEQIWYMK